MFPFSKISFNRNELSGAFGDIGTDLPLIIGMLLASDFNTANVLIVFGLMQILTGLIYGMPMAVQPLKAVALIVITQKVSGSIVVLSGLIIGVAMLILSVTRTLHYLEKIIPKTVIRGIQLGLGMQLALLAFKEYIPAEAVKGYVLAGISFVFILAFLGNRKYPPALFVLLFGVLYFLLFNFGKVSLTVSLPHIVLPELNFENTWTAFTLLALPQIPLSLSNSIFATRQLASDYYPEKKITSGKIGITYSIMNLLSSVAGGIPVCHGSGGLAGQYNFGGRTGGSAVIYGSFYLILGLFFSESFVAASKLFPLPILGVILMFEGIALMILVKDIIVDRKHFFIAILVALLANGIPYGYFLGMIIGTLIFYMLNKPFLKNYGK